MSLESQIQELARQAQQAGERCAELDSAQKNAWLHRCAERLEAARARIREANAEDMRAAVAKGVETPLCTRSPRSRIRSAASSRRACVPTGCALDACAFPSVSSE
jgi:gamma-glutamyl phosphate reductase